MKKSAKPKQNRIALLTLLFTLMVFMIFASTMLIMGLAGYILIRSGIWTIEGNAKSDLLFYPAHFPPWPASASAPFWL